MSNITDYSNEITDKIKFIKENHNSNFVNVFVLGLGTVHFPMAISMLAVNEIYKTIKSNKDVKESKMSNQWLKEVSDDKSISTKGLRFITKKVADKGYITVSEAEEWLALEEKETERINMEKNKEELALDSGVYSLIERSKKEDFNIDFSNVLSKIVDAGNSTIGNIKDTGSLLFDTVFNGASKVHHLIVGATGSGRSVLMENLAKDMGLSYDEFVETYSFDSHYKIEDESRKREMFRVIALKNTFLTSLNFEELQSFSEYIYTYLFDVDYDIYSQYDEKRVRADVSKVIYFINTSLFGDIISHSINDSVVRDDFCSYLVENKDKIKGVFK